jgi:hypothetical protein
VIHAIRDEAGGFDKVTRDITERREAEAALQAAHASMIRSQKLEAIGQLTGCVAHDFLPGAGVRGRGWNPLGGSQPRGHFREIVRRWLESHAGEVKDGTLDEYQRAANNIVGLLLVGTTQQRARHTLIGKHPESTKTIPLRRGAAPLQGRRSIQ